jgi:hypothetical protein
MESFYLIRYFKIISWKEEEDVTFSANPKYNSG